MKNIHFLYLKAFETVVKFHPHAEIMLFSNELDETIFIPYNQSKNIFIVRYNISTMIQYLPSNNFLHMVHRFWIQRIPLGKLQLSSVHFSDYFRLFLVYYYGGLYMDTDMIALRNLQALPNSIGVDDNNSFRCSNNQYMSNDNKIKNIGCVCNCIFSFDRHHPFLREVMENYEQYWHKQGYGPGGAKMLMDFIGPYIGNMNVVTNYEFLCKRYTGVRRDIVDTSDVRITDALQNCHVFHAYGAGKTDFSINQFDQTLMGRLYTIVMNHNNTIARI